MNAKTRLILFLLIPMVLFAFLAFRSFEHSAAYYYTLEEINEGDIGNSKLRIKGLLVANSVEYDPEARQLRFVLTDGENHLKASYQGVMPDNFSHAEELIIEGRLTETTEFEVTKLMLQCPSKYEEGEMEQ